VADGYLVTSVVELSTVVVITDTSMLGLELTSDPRSIPASAEAVDAIRTGGWIESHRRETRAIDPSMPYRAQDAVGGVIARRFSRSNA
jgi:hypothetical protein